MLGLLNEIYWAHQVTQSIGSFWTIDRVSVFIALLAIIVSIATLIFSVFYTRRTLKLTMKHNKLATTPALTFRRGSDFVDNSFLSEIFN